jgi:hypothetical protein
MMGWLSALKDSPQKARARVGAALLASGLPYVRDVIIPDRVGGYTQVDHLLLTASGLVLLEIQHMRGELHAARYTQCWTRFERGRRFDFDNPFLRLQEAADMIHALILGDQVGGGVDTRLIIPGPVRFARRVPEGVSTEPMLHAWLAAQPRVIPTRQRTVWRVLLGQVVHDPVAPIGAHPTHALAQGASPTSARKPS